MNADELMNALIADLREAVEVLRPSMGATDHASGVVGEALDFLAQKLEDRKRVAERRPNWCGNCQHDRGEHMSRDPYACNRANLVTGRLCDCPNYMPAAVRR